ncbi:MAG: DUF378 domain-containing protein [Rickettsiales bacterium]|jgi:uncharacterized membrane protein YuzA (DUF378 family)|nr:DUF378 domain-containing protein [Rickettsiales bacterium]
MKAVNFISWLLVIIGALNWGLIGVFGFNLVQFLFGASLISNILYILFGIGAIVLLVERFSK